MPLGPPTSLCEGTRLSQLQQPQNNSRDGLHQPAMTRPKVKEQGSRDVLFVNVSHPSQLRQRDTQKAIKRRVMRDIGRSRRKRPHPITISIDIPSAGVPNDILGDGINEESDSPWTPLSTELLISKTLQPYGYFAVQPNARARELFHFMHGAAGHAYRPFRMEWFAMAIADRCAFYLCLANGALFYQQMTTKGGSYEYSDCEESAGYFGHCTGMMAQRLGSGDDSLSEGVITTVLGFLCHDAAVGKWDRWLIHIDGLQRILQLRRGFSGLSDLVHMFAFWFDVTGSAIHDTMPRFDIPPGLPQQSLTGCELSPALANVLSGLTAAGLPQLRRALEHTALVAYFINKNAHRPQFWDGDIDTTKLLGPAAHYTLSIPRMTAKTLAYRCTSADMLCEMVRLTLLILIAGLKRSFSLFSGELAAYQEKFTTLLPLVPEAFELSPELGLWSLTVVACSYTTRSRPKPLIVALRECITKQSIDTPIDAIEVARSVIWVEATMAMEAESLILNIASAFITSGD